MRKSFVRLFLCALLLLPFTGRGETESWYYAGLAQVGTFLFYNDTYPQLGIEAGISVAADSFFLWPVMERSEHLLGFSLSGRMGQQIYRETGLLMGMGIRLDYWYQITGSEPGCGVFLHTGTGVTLDFLFHKKDDRSQDDSKLSLPAIVFGPTFLIGAGYGWALSKGRHLTLSFGYRLDVGMSETVVNTFQIEVGSIF